MVVEVDYAYLKQWLSRDEIRRIREGKNELGQIVRSPVSRQQLWKIMKRQSKNYPVLNLLIETAKQNERISTHLINIHNGKIPQNP